MRCLSHADGGNLGDLATHLGDSSLAAYLISHRLTMSGNEAQGSISRVRGVARDSFHHDLQSEIDSTSLTSLAQRLGNSYF
jgi:hypothetical protein